MDKVPRPERFGVDPSAEGALKRWRHWFVTFENFVDAAANEGTNKLNVLTNYVSSEVYELFSEADNYDDAIDILKSNLRQDAERSVCPAQTIH